MAYVVVVIWVTTRRRWSPTKALLIILAGVVPFLSFVVERRVIADELDGERAGAAVDPEPGRSSP